MNLARRDGESTPAVVVQARAVVLDRSTALAGSLPTVIEMSWERCLGYGLDHSQLSEFGVLERSLLADQMEKNRHLLIHAQPVIASSGTPSHSSQRSLK